MRSLDHGLGGGGDHHRAAGPDMLRSAGREVCGVRQTNDCQVFVSSSRLLAEKPGVLASLPRGLTT